MARLKQSRNYCFTDFKGIDLNACWEEYNDIIRYMCAGVEICPDTKKKHVQGWIQFSNKKRPGGVKKILGSNSIHIEICHGSEFQNDKYCKKENNFKEWGKFIKQGERTDLETVKKNLDAGASDLEIAESHFALWCQYGKRFNGYRQLLDARDTKEFRFVEVFIHRGPTGTGKTKDAMATNLPTYKIQGDDMKWWDGYQGEEVLVIDEYANQVPCTKLLGILDGYQLRLPIKGGFTYAKWTKVIITTNMWVIHAQAQQYQQDALERRITDYINYGDEGCAEEP